MSLLVQEFREFGVGKCVHNPECAEHLLYVCIGYYLGFMCLNAPVFVGLLSLCQLGTNKKLKYPFLSPRPRCHMIN